MADIPVEKKTEKIMPFLLKQCKDAEALPKEKFLRIEYIPKLFDQHFTAIKSLVAEGPVCIVAD